MIEVKNPMMFEFLLAMGIGFFAGFAGGNFIGRAQGYREALKEVKQEVNKRLDELVPGPVAEGDMQPKWKKEWFPGGKAKPQPSVVEVPNTMTRTNTMTSSHDFDLGSTSQLWSLPIDENSFVDIKGLEQELDKLSLKNLYMKKPKGKECKQLMIVFRGLIIHGEANGQDGCQFSF